MKLTKQRSSPSRNKLRERKPATFQQNLTRRRYEIDPVRTIEKGSLNRLPNSLQ